jgi:hypothetical protein
MAATGSHLKLQSMGDNVVGVHLEGNPRRPEPVHFRVCFPGGDIDLVRTTDGLGYWVHVRINHPERGDRDPEDVMGQVSHARLDLLSKHTRDADVGDFGSPDLYHLAVLVKVRGAPVEQASKEVQTPIE